MTLDELRRTDEATIKVPVVASLLNVGINQAYAAIDRGEIPGVLRLGRSIRVSVPALRNWLDPSSSLEGVTRGDRSI